MTTRAKAIKRALQAIATGHHADTCDVELLPKQGYECTCHVKLAADIIGLPPDPDQSAEIARLTARGDAWKAAAVQFDRDIPRYHPACGLIDAARALEKP